MTPGYASTLVARSRGQVPLLLPPTPSRFEPDGHVANPLEDVAVIEQPTPAGRNPNPTMSKRTTADVGLDPDTPPLLGVQPAPVSPVRNDIPSIATQSDTAGPPDKLRETPSPAADLDAPLMPAQGLAAPNVPKAPFSAAVDGPSWTVEATRATPEPLPSAEPIVAARRVDSQQRWTARTPENRSQDDPPIVVRIGRLDVRAVQAPPAPRPQPRPRAASGPTLEERLAARDRQ
ncbi:hypothetical protein BOO86_01385 [Mycobacterium sp. CBMA 234]|uniref:hypothetical protein n=1 Tax=Mycolicibacterium sp. CBMA 234 TaxID=1918495 RepID=UPI0012DC9E04|nr:hypothetical protein [Mycolicibacterium sp. CBMA 234]MUL63102.1 hypothetical protein [Mycolicibacterium sp. CBMA 234]